MIDLAVIILTYNEELHLARALDSVAGIASQIFVVDSGSTDRTSEIARNHGATVLTNRPFVNQAKQFQWALENIHTTASWILRLDADEIVENDLAEELRTKLPGLPVDVTGVNLKRKHVFMGRWIRYGGRYPVLMLRVFRRGKGCVEDRWMDEHITVTEGRTVTFNGGFADLNLNDLTWFTEKHNKYATREAIEALGQRHALFERQRLTAGGTSLQVSLKRWLKEGIYNRIPFGASAAMYFLWRYVFQLGFLDGPQGLVYHFLQGFWYRFLVGAKVMEFERAIAGCGTGGEILQKLTELTGHDLMEKPAVTP